MFEPAEVRRFLVEKQSLTARTDSNPAVLIRRLEAAQIDPVNLVAKNHDLVLFNRLQTHETGRTDHYLGAEGVFEYIAGNRALLPLRDLPFFIPFMRRREEHHRQTLRRLDGAARHVLSEIELRGPLTSRRIAWDDRIHGYWDAEPRTKETSHAIQLLWESGRLTPVGRAGSEIVFDLAERVLPAGLLAEGEKLPLAEARRQLRHKYYRAFGIVDAGHHDFGWQGLKAAERRAVLAEDERAGVIEPLAISGSKRTYWAVAGAGDYLRQLAGREDRQEVRFLSPLDNLLWRRERLEDLFGFTYRWEIYTPARKRAGGPYTMPILYGADLVGRLDARMDRRSGALVVQRLVFEPGVKTSKALRSAVERELERLGSFCGAMGVHTMDNVPV